MSIAEQTFYTTIKDPIYDVTQKPVSVDSNTIRKATRIIPASSNGVGAVAVNQTLNGKITVFNWSNGNTQRMRWDTTCLEVSMVFTAAAANPANPALVCAPSWNMFGRMIERIKLNFNGSATEIYNRTNGYYLPDFTARMLRYYTLEQLNKKDDSIFTPIDDYEWMWVRTNDAKYDNGGNNVRSYTANPIVGGANYAKFSDAQPPVVTHCAAAAAFFKPMPSTTTALTSAHLRFVKYVDVGPDNAADTSNLRTCTIRVPFCDLFPRFQGIMRNLRSVQLEIQWTSETAIMDYIGGTSAGHVNIIQTRVITDDYVMSQGQSMENLSEKMAGEVDNICFLDPVVNNRNWLGNDIIITAQRNVDSVMAFQMLHQQEVEVTTHTHGTTSGQFALFNAESTAVANRRYRADGIPDTTAGHRYMPQSIQLFYGDLLYPQQPVQLYTLHNNFDSTELYYEYLKMLGKVSDRLTGYPITRDLFSGTMPFIALKPFANDAIKLSDSKDIILRMIQKGAAPSVANNGLWIILFECASFRILPDGSVQTASLR